MFKATIIICLLGLGMIIGICSENLVFTIISVSCIPLAVIYLAVECGNEPADRYYGAKRNERGIYTDNRANVKHRLPPYVPKYTLKSQTEPAGGHSAATVAATAAAYTASVTASHYDKTFGSSVSEQSYPNDDFMDDYLTPGADTESLTGITASDDMDIGGGTLTSQDELIESPVINPATGDLMVGGIGGVDTEGNAYGTSSFSDSDSFDSFDSFDSSDSFSTFDSTDSFSSFDDNW